MIHQEINLNKINIYLRDGSEYLGKDMTPKPMGDFDKLVGFVENGTLTIFPIDLVKKISLYWEAEETN